MNLGQIHKLMDRKKTSHKGENGYALVVGGSEDYVTAPAIAALAALRAGCDLAAVAAPEKVAWTINMISLDLVTHKLPGETLNIKNAKDAVKLADRYDAVLLGNGSTRDSDVFNQMFVRKSMRLKVVDADALKTLSFKDFTNSLLTPHWAELELMLINSGKEFLIQKLRAANIKEQAEILQGNLRYFLHNNNVILIKGATDIIISRNKIAFNRTGNQGMTKAGTGDCLAGLCVGFLAKTQDLFKSAVAAAYINGFIGDVLLKKHEGYSFIASDLLKDLGELQKEIEVLSSRESAVRERAEAQKKEEERLAKKEAAKEKIAGKKKADIEKLKAAKEAEKLKKKAVIEKERARKKALVEKEKLRKTREKEKLKLARERVAKKKLVLRERAAKVRLRAKEVAARTKEMAAKKKVRASEVKRKLAERKKVQAAKKKVMIAKKKAMAAKKKISKKPAAKKKVVKSKKKVVKGKPKKKKSSKRKS